MTAVFSLCETSPSLRVFPFCLCGLSGQKERRGAEGGLIAISREGSRELSFRERNCLIAIDGDAAQSL